MSFSQTAIILSVLLFASKCLVHCSELGDSEFWNWDEDDDWIEDFKGEFLPKPPQSPEMNGLACYECSESLHMTCKLAKDHINYEQVLDENPNIVEEMMGALKKEGLGGESLENLLYQKLLTASTTNPCKIITNKVLQLVESPQDKLLPIYLDPEGKDSATRYESLKDAIYSIQFHNRDRSEWVLIEVQLRDKDDTAFSFILPNYELDYLNIPRNSIFYTSL